MCPAAWPRYYSLPQLYQPHSLPGAVYGPEHSETIIRIQGDGFVAVDYAHAGETSPDAYPVRADQSIQALLTYNDSLTRNVTLAARFLNRTTLETTVPQGLAPGEWTIEWNLQLEDDAPVFAAAQTAPFFYTVYATPTIDSLTPRSGPLGGGTSITITGALRPGLG